MSWPLLADSTRPLSERERLLYAGKQTFGCNAAKGRVRPTTDLRQPDNLG
jgi:hypothetical protein